jgi:copper resistance protein B
MRPVKSLILILCLGAFYSSHIAHAEDPASDKKDVSWSMADQYYDPVEMAKARKAMYKSAGSTPISFIMADRAETQFTNAEDSFVWDAQGWYGTDENKLWIKTEGEYSFSSDDIEDAEIQALWSKPVARFWDLQTGIRYDTNPKGRTHAVLGLQGLAPYWFEVDAALFLSTKGDLTSRIETEYDLLLAQKIVLQPRLEVEFSAQDIPELNIGAGITNFDLGVRLRYEIKREFAPYIGVEWQKNVGETANFIRASGDDPDKFAFLIGIRAWY